MSFETGLFQSHVSQSKKRRKIKKKSVLGKSVRKNDVFYGLKLNF